MEEQRNKAALRLAIKHYLDQVRRDWYLTAPALLLPGLGSILVFYVPTLIVAKLLTRFEGQVNPSLDEFLPYLLLFVGLWLVGEIVWRVAIHIAIKAEVKGGTRLYNQALEYLLDKDLGFFHDNFAGSLTKKVVGYGRRYHEAIDTLAFDVSPQFIPVFFVIVVLWLFSPWLVLVLLGLMAISVAIIVPLIKKRRQLVTVRETASNVVAGHIADVIANADTVKAFGREQHELQAHRLKVKDYIAKVKRSWNYQNLRVDMAISPLWVLINTSGLVVAILVSRNTGISLEVVFVTFTYYATLTRVMWEFNHIYRQLETAISDAAQYTELLLDPPKLHDPPMPADFHVSQGNIEFKNVNFRYHDDSGEHLFSGLNLAIKSGEKVALVGRSGGGKTTVTKLLLRFMDIDGGEILVDGQNIAKARQVDLRSQIAYVPQEPAMFHRTLAENIRYGWLDSSDQEVKTVAKMAHAAEFIEKLPKKYQTLVGERGIKLSGGQRQRIAIARAMLKDSPILILDEATSALDSESELLIQDALWKLMEGRTAIVIAHRLSTIQRMDRIVVLDEGEIIEEGSHTELLAKNGVYAKLWAHQSGGFLED